jgi:hypothetical protein
MAPGPNTPPLSSPTIADWKCKYYTARSGLGLKQFAMKLWALIILIHQEARNTSTSYGRFDPVLKDMICQTLGEALAV